MTQYTTAFKARVLPRLVGPRAISAYRSAGEVGVSQVTLSRRLAAARSVPAMPTPAKKWTGAQKLRVLLTAHGLSETEFGALLRREGLHAAQLEAWRVAAETALEESKSPPRESGASSRYAAPGGGGARAASQGERTGGSGRTAGVEKKVEVYWGDANDTTDPTSATCRRTPKFPPA